jgi:hypothetical protein
MSSISNSFRTFTQLPENTTLSRSSTLYSSDDATQHPSTQAQTKKRANGTFHTSFLHKFSPANTFYEVDIEKTHPIENHVPVSWQRKLSDLLVNWWAWEVSCWVVSALCMFAISVVLGFYDHKALPKEWPLGITINAYISVLSAVVKLALAVGLASSFQIRLPSLIVQNRSQQMKP